MQLTFEGWYSERKNEIREDDVWKKGYDTYVQRMDGYVSGFEPVSGEDEEELAYYYDAVRIFVYINEDGKEVSAKEYIPWHDGEEVRNTEISSVLQHEIDEILKKYPLIIL